MPHARPARSLSFALAVALAGLAGSTGAARAQCQLQWQAVGEISGVFGRAERVASFDPDGPGPRSPILVFGGIFFAAGDTAVERIAAWDPATSRWAALGSGLDHMPTAFAELPGGRLAVGGLFQTAGGVPASRTAIWDGTNWSSLGSGLDREPMCMLAMPNGDLVVGGTFFSAGGLPIALVARWNGSTWSALGTGFRGNFDSFVSALAVLPNGDLVAGGRFSLAGQFTQLNLARWDGSTWQPLTPAHTGDVLRLAVDPQGHLVASGWFQTIGGTAARSIARFDGTNWHPYGNGLNVPPTSILFGPGNTLRVAGSNLGTGPNLFGATAEWNGTSWQPYAPQPLTGFSIDAAVQLPNGDLVAAAPFAVGPAIPSRSIARWNGTTWGPLYPSTGPLPFLLGAVHDCVPMPNGDRLFVGNMIDKVIRWDGTTATPLGREIRGAVRAAVPLNDVEFVIAGDFTLPTSTTLIVDVARWNGTSWVAIPDYPAIGNVNAMVRAGNALILGGRFGTEACLRWSEDNGWSSLGTVLTGEVFDLAVMPDGAVVAGGSFNLIPGSPTTDNVARFHAGTWTRLGAGLVTTAGAGGTVRSLDFLPSGELVAGGLFGRSGSVLLPGLAKWTGTGWTPFAGDPQSRVDRMAILPDGRPVVADDFGTLRGWNGSSFVLLAPPRTAFDATPIDLAVDPDGTLYVGGQFAKIGDVVTDHLALLRSTCAASDTRIPSGCTTANGPLRLEVLRLAWLGGRLATRCHGVGPNSIALWHIGASSPGFLLSTAHPAGDPGCRNLASFDLCSKLATPDASGVLGGTENVPNDPALLGVRFFHQYTAVEFGSDGSIARIASSDGHDMTVGSF